MRTGEMIRGLITIWISLGCASVLRGQYVRYDSTNYTTNTFCASGRQCPVLAIPSAIVQICSGLTTPCTPATTYSSSAGSACPLNAQVTIRGAGSTQCVASADSQGNFGVWVPPGTYTYYLSNVSTTGAIISTKGPFPFSAGSAIQQGAAGPPGPPGPPGPSIVGAPNIVLSKTFSGTQELAYTHNLGTVDPLYSCYDHASGLGVSPGVNVTTSPSLTTTYVTATNRTVDCAFNNSGLSGISVFSSNFTFSQSPGGSLSIGANTITMAPCPPGIPTWVWISGGVGTAEPVKLTGGSCTANLASGTLVFTAQNTHSGAWTISSAGAGIPEALQACSTSGGGTVYVPAGIAAIHASVLVPTNCNLIGSGRDATILQIPNGEFINAAQWQLYGFNPSGVAIGTSVGGGYITIASLRLDMNGANQPSAPNGSYGIETVNSQYVRVTDVEINNGPILVSGNTFLPLGYLGTASNNIADHSYVFNQVCSVSSQGAGGFIIGGARNRVELNYVLNGCNTAYISGGTDNIFVGNIFDIGGSTQVAGAQAYAADNGIGTIFAYNDCIGNGTAPACYSVTTDNASPVAQSNTFIGNNARNCGQGYQFKIASANIIGVTVEGGDVSTCVVPLSITGIIQDMSIRGVVGLLSGHSDSITSFSNLSLPALVNGLNENVEILSFGVIRTSGSLGPTGAFSLGGFKEGFDGRALTIINNSGQSMTVKNLDTGSNALNRICTGAGADVTLTHNVANFVYALADSCWWLTGQN